MLLVERSVCEQYIHTYLKFVALSNGFEWTDIDAHIHIHAHMHTQKRTRMYSTPRVTA